MATSYHVTKENADNKALNILKETNAVLLKNKSMMELQQVELQQLLICIYPMIVISINQKLWKMRGVINKDSQFEIKEKQQTFSN